MDIFFIIVKQTYKMENNNPQEIPAANNEETIFTAEDFAMQGYDKHIRQARNTIFAAAGLLLLSLLILCFTISSDYEYLWIDICIYGLFIAGFIVLGFWTKKKPYYAIIGALILYILLIALNAYFDISTLYKGLILKIIIIVFLVKGLGDAKEAQYMQDQIRK
jgi:quinol-cytochrome oxidoreductase complex cytochrome b subunit